MGNDRLARGATAVERACAHATSVVDLCRSVKAAIDPVVPSDRWCGFAVDPSTMFATNGFHDEGVAAHLLPRLLELEVATDDTNHIPALARSKGGVSILTEATGGDPASCARWRDVLQPSGVSHELRAVFRTRGHTWGALVLFRAGDSRDFDADDATFVRRVAPTVAAGFRRVLVRQHLDYADDAREAGVVMLGGNPLELRMATNAARYWLDQLDDGCMGGGLPTAVVSAAQAARVAPRTTTAVRARTRAGRWVTITAEVVEVERRERSDVGLVVQPSRPAEIAHIVGAAHGLTSRESDIVLLVAAGNTNSEIARALGLSQYTVADHLKRTFGKLGVSTRGELTSKLFFDHYLPRAVDGRNAGADGWFLPD